MSHRRRMLTVERWSDDFVESARLFAAASDERKGAYFDLLASNSAMAYRHFVETDAYYAFAGCGSQVYMLDDDFAESIHTEKWIDLLPSVIGRVPHEGFYVTLPTADEYEGAVVHVRKMDEIDRIDVVLWREYLVEFQSNQDENIFIFSGNDSAFMVRADNGDMYGVMIMYIPEDIEHMYDDYVLPDIKANLIANVIAYVCSKNADICVSYRPSGKSRRKNVSRATWHDVGFRIGAELRQYERTKCDPCPHQGGTVRPHMRRAHWHHYWTGPRGGDRQLVLKWIPPIAVGIKNGAIGGATGHRVLDAVPSL